MSANQNQDEKIREDLRAAIAQVAKAHNITVNIGDVLLETTEHGAVADVQNVSVTGNEEQIAAVIERIYEAREAHAKMHSKTHYRHRMIVALSIGAGIYGFYSVMHREFVLHGLEYLIPAVVDKMIFGLGE